MDDLATLRNKIARYRRLADFAGDQRTGDAIHAFVQELEEQANGLEWRLRQSSRGLASKPRNAD